MEDGWTVIDIGAGLGDFAVHVAKGRPHSTIYAYEPFPQSFALLQENLRLNQIENVKVFPYAVCAQAGPTCLYLQSEAVAHTIVRPESGTLGDTIEVSGLTLDQIFAELQLTHCDYLKMDCEGAEWDILFNTSPATLHKIKHLCLESREGATGFSHHDLVQFLTERGFAVGLTPCPAYRQQVLLYARKLDPVTGSQ